MEKRIRGPFTIDSGKVSATHSTTRESKEFGEKRHIIRNIRTKVS